MTQFTLVVYDTPSDKRRRRLANLLKNFMFRVQKSVFEGHLPDFAYELVLAGARRIMDDEEDSIRIYRLPKDAFEQIDILGLPPITEDQNHYFVGQEPEDS